jgi:competence protein ComGC
MRKLKEWVKNSSGFTLIEMAIVLFIISVLLLLIVPNISNHRESASGTRDEAIVKVVETQKTLYEMEKKVSNPSIQQLVAAGYLTQEQADQYNQAKR